MLGTTDVDGVLRSLTPQQFSDWHAYFQHEDREAVRLTLPGLAMQHNSTLCMMGALSGSKIPASAFKTPDDFIGGQKKRRDTTKLSAQQSERRAAARYGRK